MVLVLVCHNFPPNSVVLFILPYRVHAYMCICVCLFPCLPSVQRVIRGRSQSLDTMGISMRKQQPATLSSRPTTAGLALSQSVAEGPKAIAAVRYSGGL